MYDELKEFLEKVGEQQAIPFVFLYKKKYYCTKHLHLNLHNIGRMKQHIGGRMHKLDWHTGKRITKLLEKDQNIESINQELDNTNLVIDSFDELDSALDKIFESQDKPKGLLLAEYGLKGKLRDVMMNYLEIRKTITIIRAYS